MDYLKQHRRVLYTDLLTNGRRNSYLADIDKQAEDLFFRLVKEILKSATAFAIIFIIYCAMLFILEENGVKAIPCL